MAEILRSLNREWSAIAGSPSARRALMRWSATHPVLTSAADLDDVIDLGFNPDDGPEVRHAFLEELVTASSSSGISDDVLATILRSRVGGESMADLAAEQQVTLKVLWHRRWRAEARLRDCALSA